MNPTTHATESNAPAPVLYLALELSNRSWRLALGDGAKHRQVSVPAADLSALAGAVTKAKERFKLPASARVASCYEAGRDCFWLHRHLVSIGIENQVVDAASIALGLRLGSLTLWDGRHLTVELKAELERERERLVLVERQIDQLEATRRERLQNPRSDAERKVVHLMRLGAIGPASAWLLVKEFFGWRAFHNRREVAPLAGWVGTPYNSGESERDQGI